MIIESQDSTSILIDLIIGFILLIEVSIHMIY
jgi:hypothetical protein